MTAAQLGSTRLLPFGAGRLRDCRSRHTVWFSTAVWMMALFAVSVLAGLVDERSLNGVSVWNKPAKFYLSIAVYFATLAWFAPLMPGAYFATRRGRALSAIPVAFAVMEMAYITLQAARGEPSHFNTSSPLYAAMYSLMGFGAVCLVLVCLWMGAAILNHHRGREPYALAVALGLITTCLLGGGFGSYLGAQAGHWVGGAASDAGGLPLVNWSTSGGDLRVAHFFGMHAMQMVPLLGVALPGALGLLARRWWVVVVTLAWTAISIATFVQALAGRPLL